MRIAIFGGSFDPPHRGHLAIARAAVERLALDVLWMAPAGTQPLKQDLAMTGYADRMTMVQLAVASQTRIVASEVDRPRSDGAPNYTVDLLRQVRAELNENDELFFLLGADAFLSLRHWHCAADLPFLARFIIAGRPGSSMEDVPAVLPEGIRATRLADQGESQQLVTWKLVNRAGQRSELYFLPDLHEEISATDIRAAISGEESAAGVLAPAVLRYIEERCLYR